MSRRAKLIFSALFLLLLGAIFAGMFLASTPENPLRFTIVAPAPEDALVIPGSDRYDDRVFYVTVENITGKEILFYCGNVMGREALNPNVAELNGPHGSVLPVQDWSDSKEGASPVMLLAVPPHGTVRCTMFLEPGMRAEIIRKESGQLIYRWSTKVRLRWADYATWMREHAPSSARKYLLFEPIQIDSAPLDLPAK